MNNKINLIYATYNPQIDILKKSVQSIIEQVDKIYIIDNTPTKDNHLEFFENDKTEIIYLQENYGIAYAFNIGIKKALQNKANFIMLSDQDTYYPKNYIFDMLNVFLIDDKIAAVSPRFVDTNKKGRDGFIGVVPIIFKRFFPKSGTYEIMQAISSGKILQAKYIKTIGIMDEMLFIDWVDYEWCWRARAKGYKIVGNADVIIEHQLGESSKNLGFREVNLRSHIRHYYITRNAFYLALHSNDLDILHRITLFFKSFRYIVGYPILSKPHLTHLKYVLLGFWHGIIGRMGKLE